MKIRHPGLGCGDVVGEGQVDGAVIVWWSQSSGRHAARDREAVEVADDFVVYEKLVVLQGLENFIVVDTPDVLLICERTREQQIKEYVAEVKRNKGDKFL